MHSKKILLKSFGEQKWKKNTHTKYAYGLKKRLGACIRKTESKTEGKTHTEDRREETKLREIEKHGKDGDREILEYAQIRLILFSFVVEKCERCYSATNTGSYKSTGHKVHKDEMFITDVDLGWL